MGGLGALAGMMPGMKKAKAAMAQSGMDDKVLLRMDAIIGSMTPKERAKPELLNAKRKIRVAKGSGTTVQDVNKLMKMHQEMEADEADQEDGRPQGPARCSARVALAAWVAVEPVVWVVWAVQGWSRRRWRPAGPGCRWRAQPLQAASRKK
jgi:hypothetical protein